MTIIGLAHGGPCRVPLEVGILELGILTPLKIGILVPYLYGTGCLESFEFVVRYPNYRVKRRVQDA